MSVQSSADASPNAQALAGINPLIDQTIEGHITHELRRLIVSGILSPGTRLTQREVANRFEVSQTPVRAALAELEADGLVAAGARGRCWVTDVSQEDMEEVYAMRVGLEGLAARVGAQRVGGTELELMAKYLEQLALHAERMEVEEYLAVRWQFHVTCYGAAGRERLVTLVERLAIRAERYNRLLLSDRDRLVKNLTFKEAFLIACREHDGEAAETDIHEAFKWGAACLTPLLKSSDEAREGATT